MMLDPEAMGAGHRFGERMHAVFELGRRIDVEDGSAGIADDVVMVAGEILGQFVPCGVVSREQPMHHAGLLEDGEISIGGALGETGAAVEEFGHGERSIGTAEGVDEGASIGGVALSVLLQPLVGGAMEFDE